MTPQEYRRYLLRERQMRPVPVDVYMRRWLRPSPRRFGEER